MMKNRTGISIFSALALSLSGLAIARADSPSADEVSTLERFVERALHENLALKASAARAVSAEANAGSLAIPPPMVGVIQTRDPSGSAAGFEVSQSLPFPGKVSADRSARRSESATQGALLKLGELEVRAQARLLYFRIWQRQERVSLLQEKKRAIEQHVKLATAGARSDSFQKIHVIKAESDLDFLDNEILQAWQDTREAQIEAAVLVNADPAGFQLRAIEPRLTELPSERATAAPLKLEVPKLELAVLQSREREQRASWFPDLNLRYREMGGTQMTPRFSEIMVGVSLPFVFFWEPHASSLRASSERQAGEIRLAQEKNRFSAERELLLSRARALRKQLEQIREKILPRAEKRMRLVHNLAPRDLEILQDHRETMEALPDLKLKALEIRGQYEGVVAELGKYGSGSEK